MNKLQQMMLLLVFIGATLHAGPMVKITDNHGHSSRGFIVKEKGKFYVYTAQTTLFGVKKPKISNDYGEIKTAKDYQISSNSDVARIRIAGEFKDFYTIGENININDGVVYKSGAWDSIINTEISGLGIRIFKIKEKFKRRDSGLPVLNSENKLIGILSSWQAAVTVKSEPPFLQYEEENPRIVTRLDKQIKWLSARKTKFEDYGVILKESKVLQKDFLPMIQWWYENPYRQVEDDVEYSEKMATWVKYNNRKNKIIDQLIAKIAEDPQKHKSLMKSLKNATLHRTKLLYAFPSSRYQKLQIKWPTDFLRSKAMLHTESWENILRVINIRKKNLVFVMPHEISDLKEAEDEGL